LKVLPSLHLLLSFSHRSFRTYGPLRYAKITMDRATGRSRGTGFVCFWKKEDADRAVEQARLMSVETGSGANSVPVRLFFPLLFFLLSAVTREPIPYPLTIVIRSETELPILSPPRLSSLSTHPLRSPPTSSCTAVCSMSRSPLLETKLRSLRRRVTGGRRRSTRGTLTS
jgi:hypothetical protein